jgi:hypothetical protein
LREREELRGRLNLSRDMTEEERSELGPRWLSLLRLLLASISMEVREVCYDYTIRFEGSTVSPATFESVRFK